MSVLGRDDFDRTGALGVNWLDVPDPGASGDMFTCDGDAAIMAQVAPSPSFALFTAISGSTLIDPLTWNRALRHQAKITRGQLNQSSLADIGLIFNVRKIVQNNGLNTYWVWHECFLQVQSSGTTQVILRKRVRGTVLVSGGTLGWVNNTYPVAAATWNVSWNEGEARTLTVEHNLQGNDEAVVLLDGTYVGQASIAAAANTKHGGILAFFTAPTPTGTPPAVLNAQPSGFKHDIFKDSDTASLTAQVAPSPRQALTLTSLAVVQEADFSGGALPIDPDEFLPASYTAQTNRQVMAAGYTIRAARWGTVRGTWQMTWSNLTETDAATLKTFFGSTTAGGLNHFTWTHPEMGSKKFVVAQSEWTEQRVGPGGHTLRATCIEVE